MLLKVLILVTVICFVKTNENSYSLRQVVILSRHNVRTPLAKNLASLTPKSWPKWTEKSGYLTQKGVLLEGFMGEYFSAWLKEKGLISNQCPDDKEIFVYANIKQRTEASAQAFIDKAFPGCKVKVHTNSSEMIDPVFNPVIHNSSSIFKQIAIGEMQECLKSLHLNESYEILGEILNYKESELCTKEKKCDLKTDANKISVKVGSKPNVIGPLKIGNSAIDAFIMENYEGLSSNDIAWGKLVNTDLWKTIMLLNKEYHNVIFNTTIIAKDISRPLIKYMSQIFLNDTAPKLSLLMGHDANMYTVLKGMEFKPYILNEQFEMTPVGGKIVFQKYVSKDGESFLRIDYIYQCTEQMRKGTPLGLDNPPEIVQLELEKCKTDNQGFCNWKDFVKMLNLEEKSVGL